VYWENEKLSYSSSANGHSATDTSAAKARECHFAAAPEPSRRPSCFLALLWGFEEDSEES